MNWYIKCLKQYADFKGRARRKEYWMFVLFNCIFSLILTFADHLLHLQVKMQVLGDTTQINILATIYAFAVLIPGIAACVRRLHDAGKSGWYWLIDIIPVIGPIWLLVLLCKDSQPGENKYGPNPKENCEA